MMFGEDYVTINGSTIIPSARYRDEHAAIAWLCDVLGFERHAVYEAKDGSVEHAELRLGKGMFMLGSARKEPPYPHAAVRPEEVGGQTTSLFYIVVEDCGAVEARAQQAKAEFLTPMKTMEYGGRALTLRDPEGHIWSVGEYDPWANQPS